MRHFASWRSLTFLSLLGIALGFVAGLGADLAPAAVKVGLGAVARAWTNALRLIVLPLIVSRLFLAITAGQTSEGEARRIGICTPLVFAGLLVLTAALTLVVTPSILALPRLRSLSMTPAEPLEAAPTVPVADATHDPLAWVDAFLPPNLFAAAATTAILPLMLFTAALALAVRKLAPEPRRVLEVTAQGIAEAMSVLVRWLMVAAPVVVFAVTFRAAAGDPLRMGGVLLAFLLVNSGMLALATLALYPLAIVLGRVRPGRFARAMLPGQIAAVNTRSSLATVPVLMQSADQVLGIPRASSAFVVPLAGATLKVSRAVNNPLTLLFILHTLGLSITPAQLLVFVVTILLTSPTTVGLPSVRSEHRSLPAFVAAGVPAEYVIWLGTVNVFTDVLQTLANTTSYMTANVLVHRLVGGRAREAPTPGEAAPTGELGAEPLSS